MEWQFCRAILGNAVLVVTFHYTLEEFGLSKEWIQEELGPLLDHYSLTR